MVYRKKADYGGSYGGRKRRQHEDFTGSSSDSVLLELVRRWIVKILALEEKNQRLQEKLDAMEQLYGEMQEEIEVTKKYRHDMKKHIHVLEGLLEKYGEVNAQGEYVGSENIKAITQNTMYSDNIFIDTICTLKNKQLQGKRDYFADYNGFSGIRADEGD